MIVFGKKKETVAITTTTESKIKVLGGGCARCHELQANTEDALKELGFDLPVELITDYEIIASYGIMSLPALVINDQVVSFGKVLKVKDVKKLLGESL